MKTRRRFTTLIIVITMITTTLSHAQYKSDSTNTMRGYNAGNLQTGGRYNSVYGYRAGDKVVGDHNTFLGTYAGGLSTASGNDNTFVGSYSGSVSTTSTSNVFVGFGAGRLTTSGSYNVFLGKEAGRMNTNGANNISIAIPRGRTLLPEHRTRSSETELERRIQPDKTTYTWEGLQVHWPRVPATYSSGISPGTMKERLQISCILTTPAHRSRFFTEISPAISSALMQSLQEHIPSP